MATPIDKLLITLEIEEGTKAKELLDKLDKITDASGNVTIDFKPVQEFKDMFEDIIDKVNSINRVHSRWKSIVAESLDALTKKIRYFQEDLEVYAEEEEELKREILETIKLAHEDVRQFIGMVGANYFPLLDTYITLQEFLEELLPIKPKIKEAFLEELQVFKLSLIRAFENVLYESNEIERIIDLAEDINRKINNSATIRQVDTLIRKIDEMRNVFETNLKEIDMDIYQNTLDIRDIIQNFDETVAGYSRRGFEQQMSKYFNDKLTDFKSILDDNLKEVINDELKTFLDSVSATISNFQREIMSRFGKPIVSYKGKKINLQGGERSQEFLDEILGILSGEEEGGVQSLGQAITNIEDFFDLRLIRKTFPKVKEEGQGTRKDFLTARGILEALKKPEDWSIDYPTIKDYVKKAEQNIIKQIQGIKKSPRTINENMLDKDEEKKGGMEGYYD